VQSRLASFGGPAVTLIEAVDLKIISWNLLHTSGASVEQVELLIAHHRPDLLLMQEATARIDTLSTRIGGYYARIALPGRKHGLAAWSRQPFQSPVTSLPLQRGMIVKRLAQILKLQEFTVANVHLSHGQFLNRFQLRQISNALPNRAAILGDCNLVGSPMLRGFEDVGPRQPTHRSANIIPLRLDRCFIKGLRCTSSEVLNNSASDHKPIMVELATL
jgi:endonuclease/exonuclease/phosphatase (EEP) superfamily protein YafD